MRPSRATCLALLGLGAGTPVAAQSRRAAVPAVVESVKDGAEMVLVARGPFPQGPSTSRQRPVTVDVPEFYLDRYEVTNERYRRFLKERPSRQATRFQKSLTFGRPNLPVVGVGWPDAVAYCTWAGKRLPTEIEWEKAARGPTGRIFPWGNTYDPHKFNGRETGPGAPVAVGSYHGGDSPYGASDMAGNVWEMTSTSYQGNDPAHAMKGGSFLNREIQVRTSYRWAAEDEAAGASWLGFRCVMDPQNLGRWARAR